MKLIAEREKKLDTVAIYIWPALQRARLFEWGATMSKASIRARPPRKGLMIELRVAIVYGELGGTESALARFEGL